METPFVWFDLMTSETAVARRFYEQLLGWRGQDGMADAGAYMMSAGDKPFAFLKTQAAADHPPHWVPYVHVPDVGAATKRAVELGGVVLQADIQGPAGNYSLVEDPTGAVLALWQPRS